ncbi:MFS transporter [Occultella gossypii]|uniref:MFS transporter n=1 Tax=Occultella gossypii TaxID=2800820 RepID=A0ABS7SFB0_9MICO|nr:MFS transporter [Occultella gossypii]MBZ2199038.1 MFS transporter [Occultella gossypii]
MLCLTQIVGWGVLYYSFPVALPAITAETGWSATSTLAAFSAALVVAAGAGVAVGRVIDQHGPRWVMTGGSALATGAVLVIAWAPNLGWFVTGWVIAGLAQSMVLYAPAFTAITRWYGPARTRALLTVTLVAGLASTIFAPVTAALLEQLGWRHTYLVLAALLALVTIPAHALGLRAPWPPHRHRSLDPGARPGQGTRAIARSRAFVALTVATSLGAFAMFAATIHLIPMLTWRGLSASAAAWALGLSGAGQLAGRLAYAPLAGRTTPVSRAVAILALSGAGVAAVGLLPGPGPALVAAAIGLGVVRGAYTLLQSTAVSDRWGTEGFGALYGILNAPTTLAMALAPWVAGVLKDTTGSYPATFAALAGAAGLAAFVATRTAPPSAPDPHLP